MDSMIHIGNEINKNKDSALDAAAAIDMVFGSARKNTMDQQTVVEALQALARVAEIKNITITNSNFTNSAPAADEKDTTAEQDPMPEAESYSYEDRPYDTDEDEVATEI